MVKFSVVTLLILSTAFGALARAADAIAGAANCFRDRSDGLEFKYCVDETDPSLNPDILFYFHADGASEEAWRKSPLRAALKGEWDKLGVHSPSVITLSLGSHWMLVIQKTSSVRDLHALFVNVLVSRLERALSKPRTGRRLLLGEGFGGLNAALIALKSGGTFKKAALVCPTLLPVSPFATEKDLESAAARTGARKETLVEFSSLLRKELRSPENWPEHDPVQLATDRLTRTSPPLFIECSEKSELGSCDAAKQIQQTAEANSARIDLITSRTAACASDVSKLAQFFVPALTPPKSSKE